MPVTTTPICFKIKAVLFFFLASLLTTVAQPASASLIGDEMVLAGAIPDVDQVVGTSPPFIVGPGSELTLEQKVVGQWLLIGFVLDITESSVIFSFPEDGFYSATEFNGYIITETSNDPTTFAGAFVDPATTVAAFDSSRIWVEESSLFVNMSGVSVRAGEQVQITVPEPSTWTTLMIGLVAIASRELSRFRRKRTSQR